MYVIGNIINNEVNTNTGNITTISGKIKHITSTNVDTVLTSRLKILDVNNSALYCVILSNDTESKSAIKSDLELAKNLKVLGNISNTELNTNTSNITTISENITTISGQINTISGLVNTNTANITTISGLVNTNTTNITTISGLVNTNTTNIEKLSNVINVQGDAASGYTINIGFATSKVYINGDLYYNNDLFLRNANSDGNQVGMNEYINQFF